jgi:phage-related protein
MASKAELALILSLVDDVTSTAKTVKGELEGIGKEGMSVQKVIGDLGNIGFGILKAGAIIGAAAITAVGAALTSCVKDAMDFQQVAAQTEAVIKSTGGAAGMTTEEILAMADALQTTTRFSDDAILQGQNLLLTFTNIGEDVFPAATQAMLDMATALGTDASGSAIQLGKALNDPTKGIAALTRVGVVFTDEQKKLIKSLQESGDLAGAQAVILQELQKEFGGSAEAAGKTFAGQLDILKNRFGDLKKDIGMKFLPVLTQVGQALMDTLAKPEVKAAIDGIITAIGNFAAGLAEVVTLLIQGDVQGALTEIFGADVATQIIDITSAISDFVSQIAIFVTQHAEAFKGALIAIAALLGGAMLVSGITSIVTLIGSLASPIGLIVAAVGLLGAAWAGNWGGIQEKTQAVIAWLTPYVNGAITAISDWWAVNGATIIATVVATWEWIKTAISDAIAYIGPIVSGAITAISTWWTENGATIIGTITATWTWIQGIFQAAVDIIQPIVQNALASISVWWSAWGSTVMSGVQNVWNFIVNAFQVYFEVVRAVVETVWAAIQAIWEMYGTQIMAVITNVWEIITTVFETAFTFIKTLFEGFVLLFNGDIEGFAMKVTEAFTALWDGIVKIVTLAWDNIKLVAAVAMDAIGLALTAAWEWIKGIFVAAWDGLVLYITNSWESFKTAISTIVTGVITFFTDTDWGQIGIDIINGIITGVTDTASALWEAIKSAVSGAIQAVLDLLDAHSPSRETANLIGKPFVQGIGMGIEKAMRLLEQTQLPDMTARLVGVPGGQIATMQPGGYQQPAMAGNTYNYSMVVNTSARDEDIIADFSLMNAMAGA